jgi:aryl-alcohol dehydrogenase-like predicted oxidoreductase
MGCWGIGGQWGAVSDAEAIRTIHAALDAGVNLFDTADAYGIPLGRSEELTGRALRKARNHVYIATKVGNWARRIGHPLDFTSPEHVVLCCHASLFRLRTDYIDFYQCHIGDIDDPTLFLEGMERLRADGLVRAYGISTDSVEALRKFNVDGTCSGCQLNYSALNRSAERALLPYCLDNGIGTLIRGPLAQGILAGKFNGETRFDDSVRSSWNESRRDWFKTQVALVERLRFLERPVRNLAQAALQFVLAHPAVTCAIPGAKSPEQARMNASATESRLTADELDRIAVVLDGAQPS